MILGTLAVEREITLKSTTVKLGHPRTFSIDQYTKLKWRVSTARRQVWNNKSDANGNPVKIAIWRNECMDCAYGIQIRMYLWQKGEINYLTMYFSTIKSMTISHCLLVHLYQRHKFVICVSVYIYKMSWYFNNISICKFI